MAQMELRRSLILLFAGLLLAGAVLYVGAREISVIGQDDVASLLTAMCHQGDYMTSIPQGEWSSAGEWQRYWRLDRVGCFSTIRRDLGLYDIHPPLYFWLLHVWLALAGTSFGAAAMLNIAPHLAAGVLVFANCRLLGCRPYVGAAAALFWMLARSTLLVPLIIRQYSLLALMSAFLLLALLAYTRTSHVKTGVLVYLAALGGLLTQYLFLLLLIIALAWWGLLFAARRQGARFAGLLAASAAAGGTLLVLHPLLANSILYQQEARQPFNLAELPIRLQLLFTSLINYILPVSVLEAIGGRMGGVVAGGLLLSGAVVVAVLVGGRATIRRASRRFHLDVAWLPVAIALTLLVVLFLLFVLYLTPRLGVGARYLALLSPWVFVVAGQVLQRFTQWTRWWPLVVAVLLVYQIVYGVSAVIENARQWRQFALPAYLVDGRPLVVDSLHRNILPRILWSLPAETPVYADGQARLHEAFPIFPDTMSGLVYIWVDRYDNSVATRDRLLAQFEAQGFQVTAEEPSVHELGLTYLLERTTP